MAADADSTTNPTLLARLRGPTLDQVAWGRFVHRYGPKIYQWCRRWNLQLADAEDVTQNVLLKLADKMRHFSYDSSGSFRGWLRTLTHHAWHDYLLSRQRLRTAGDSAIRDALETIEAGEDLTRRLEEEFDLELLELAKERVRQRVAAHTWEAFRLTALEGLPGVEVAPRVGMQVAMVFAAKSKVQKMLRAEVHKLEGGPEHEAEQT